MQGGLHLFAAECRPCKFEQFFADEDSAIQWAEDHVFDFHRHTPAVIRAQEFMGHVQMRSPSQVQPQEQPVTSPDPGVESNPRDPANPPPPPPLGLGEGE